MRSFSWTARSLPLRWPRSWLLSWWRWGPFPWRPRPFPTGRSRSFSFLRGSRTRPFPWRWRRRWSFPTFGGSGPRSFSWRWWWFLSAFLRCSRSFPCWRRRWPLSNRTSLSWPLPLRTARPSSGRWWRSFSLSASLTGLSSLERGAVRAWPLPWTVFWGTFPLRALGAFPVRTDKITWVWYLLYVVAKQYFQVYSRGKIYNSCIL